MNARCFQVDYWSFLIPLNMDYKVELDVSGEQWNFTIVSQLKDRGSTPVRG
jgi:hypothetical protein